MSPRLPSLLLVWLALSGCGPVPTTDDGQAPRTGTARASIINGVPSGADDDAAVGIAHMPGGSFSGFCSGVLVAPNVVLTARHCVSKTDEGANCSKDGKPLLGGVVYSDHKAGDLAILVGSKARFTFDARGKTVYRPDIKSLCNADISIIVLDTKLSAPIAKIRLDTLPEKDEKILAVGWGVSNNSSGYGRRRRPDIPIIAVGPASGGTIGGAVGPSEFAIGEGICSGDSGGPALDMVTGAVLGVVSRGTNGAPYDPATDPPYTHCVDTPDYKTHNIYTRVGGFKDLLLAAFAEAGAEPWLEGGPDPRKAKFGEACDGPDACRSALCIEAAGKRFCSDKCGADSPCPDGYTCQAAGDSSVCAPTPPPADPPPASTDGKSGCAVAASPSPSTTTDGAAPLLSVCALSALGLAAALRARRRR